MLLLLGLLFDGTFIRIWSLNHESRRLTEQIATLKTDSVQLKHAIERVKDPLYIERLARDRFDWVGPDELIFVFDDTDTY